MVGAIWQQLAQAFGLEAVVRKIVLIKREDRDHPPNKKEKE